MCLKPLLNMMSAHNLTAIKAPHLVEAAVKVNDVLAAAPLVQSVDILSNDASQVPAASSRVSAAWVALGSALATLGQPSADRLQYLRLFASS